jgi:hypothetical protein
MVYNNYGKVCSDMVETTISISDETRDQLKQFLSKAETYDKGIRRLILIASAKEERLSKC